MLLEDGILVVELLTRLRPLEGNTLLWPLFQLRRTVRLAWSHESAGGDLPLHFKLNLVFVDMILGLVLFFVLLRLDRNSGFDCFP